MCKSINICDGSYFVYNDTKNPYKEIFDKHGFIYDAEHLDKVLNMALRFRCENEWDDESDEYESIFDAMDGIRYHGSFIKTFPTGEEVSFHHIDNFYGNRAYRQLGGAIEGFMVNVKFLDMETSKKIETALFGLFPTHITPDFNHGRLTFAFEAHYVPRQADLLNIDITVQKITDMLTSILAENRNRTQGNICPNCGGKFEYGEAECPYCHYVSPIREASLIEIEKNKETVAAAVNINKQKSKHTFSTLLLALAIIYFGYNALIVVVFMMSQVFHLF